MKTAVSMSAQGRKAKDEFVQIWQQTPFIANFVLFLKLSIIHILKFFVQHSKIILIFAITESATLPVDQRTRAELLFYTFNTIRNMKLEMSRGCIADWLGADGVLEIDMDDETRAKVYDKIIEFLKSQNDGLNRLMQFTLEMYGEYESDDKPCDCCGDTVDTWTLEL